jgi:hypothetical protein
LVNDGFATIHAEVSYSHGYDIEGFGMDGVIYLEKLNGTVWTRIEAGQMAPLDFHTYLQTGSKLLTQGTYRIIWVVECGYSVVSGANAKITRHDFCSVAVQLKVRKVSVGLDGIAISDSQKDNMFRLSISDLSYLLYAVGAMKWYSPDKLKSIELTNSGFKAQGATDIPAGLGGGSRPTGGNSNNTWGLVYSSVRTNATTTTIYHNITDTKFTVIVTPRGSFTWYLSSVSASSSNTSHTGTIVIVCSIDYAVFDYVIVRTPY